VEDRGFFLTDVEGIMPRFTVIMYWQDGEVEDADEMVVTAATPQGAVQAARRRWRETVGQTHPHCRLVKAWILTAERIRALA